MRRQSVYTSSLFRSVLPVLELLTRLLCTLLGLECVCQVLVPDHVFGPLPLGFTVPLPVWSLLSLSLPVPCAPVPKAPPSCVALPLNLPWAGKSSNVALWAYARRPLTLRLRCLSRCAACSEPFMYSTILSPRVRLRSASSTGVLGLAAYHAV